MVSDIRQQAGPALISERNKVSPTMAPEHLLKADSNLSTGGETK